MYSASDEGNDAGRETMANGLAKGFTRISNIILDNIMKGDFSKREHILLNYVFRNGYGWGHDQSACDLDTSKIAKDTGLDVSNINETLRLLEGKNVMKRENGKILFNRHVEQWKKVETTPKSKRLKQPRNKVKTTSSKGQSNLDKGDKTLSVSDLPPLKESIKENNKPHTPSIEGLLPVDLFEEIWVIYPNKASKKYARKAFQKINPNKELFDSMKKAIETHSRSRDWTNQNGQFIPHFSTWLNQERWEDEIKTTAQTGFGLGDDNTEQKGYGL